jgi:hypothetical protein
MNHSLDHGYPPYPTMNSIISLVSKSAATNNGVHITSESERDEVYYR